MTPTADGNGWDKHKKYVEETLKELKAARKDDYLQNLEAHAEILERITKVDRRMAVLEAVSIRWNSLIGFGGGILGGIITGVAVWLLTR